SHYVGNFGFFGVHGEEEHNIGHHHPDEGGHEMSHNMKFDFIFDLTKTIARLREEEAEMRSQFNVQLIPIPIVGSHVQSVEIKTHEVEIIYI
ncbi:hypothetical protein, partial [Calothrix rhizosoleniae]|uniref:hypothetical protein n=1 Tax=Calothrix rhizosoleniae TaxID=888997 RepID=UPI001356480F